MIQGIQGIEANAELHVYEVNRDDIHSKEQVSDLGVAAVQPIIEALTSLVCMMPQAFGSLNFFEPTSAAHVLQSYRAREAVEETVRLLTRKTPHLAIFD